MRSEIWHEGKLFSHADFAIGHIMDSMRLPKECCLF